MGSVIRFILILLASLLLARLLLDKLFAAKSRPARRRTGRRDPDQVRTVSGRTVQDPQCGTHVATPLAIPYQRPDGEKVHFCSRECRQAYIEALRQEA